MWLFLSRRLRTWLLLAVAIPLARRVLARAAAARDRSDPTARSTALLRRIDTSLGNVQSRRGRKHRRG